MRIGRVPSALVVVAILMLAAQLVPTQGMAGPHGPGGYQVLDTFDNLQVSRDHFFDRPGFNNQSAIVLPNHAFVERATVNMSFGTYPGTRSAPWDPALDVGEDGLIDWRFDSSRGGPLGLQDSFSDGEKAKELRFTGGDYRDFFVSLPRDAVIKEAYLDVEGYPIPTWVRQYTLTPRTDSKGEAGPKMAEFDGELWVIWDSEDQNITTGEDQDIVVRRFDGKEWDRIVELSQPTDTEEDDIPQLIAYKDKLYAIWSKGDGGATAVSNTELVYRAYDGTSWSEERRISGPKERGLNTYERCVVFKDRLYVVWKTSDPQVCIRDSFSDDLDIVYRSFDGENWGRIVEITAAANDGVDWSVDAIVYRGMMYVIWDTWDSGITGRSRTSDIVYRAFDGQQWTQLRNLSPYSDASTSSTEVLDALPRLWVYDNPVTGEDELFAIWMRGQTKRNNAGDGYHIVYRRYSGGVWSQMVQLSEDPSGEKVDQMFPSLITFNGTLYAIWTIGTNTTEHKEGDTKLIATYGDIIIRSFDGERWSPILELTPLGNGYDNASHPSIYIYDGKVYAAWETPLPTPWGTRSWEIVMRHLELSPVTVGVAVGEDRSVVWGPERLSNVKKRVYLDAEAMTETLNAAAYNHKDVYGNKYTDLPIRVTDEAAANLRITNLTIVYDYNITVDFTETAEEWVDAHRDNTHVDKDVRIVFKISTGQAGRITLEDPNVEYYLDYPPFLEEPVPEVQVHEDEGQDNIIDLEEYFSDDWDDGFLTFGIVSTELLTDAPDDGLTTVEASLIGSMLSVRLPRINWNGEAQVVVRAYDTTDFYHNDSNAFIIRVLPVNDAPILQFVPDKDLEVEVEYVTYLTAWDPDAEDRDRLRYSSDLENVVVDEETGRLKVTLHPWDENPLFFNVTVEDPQGASDSQEVQYYYTMDRVRVESEDDFPYALFLLLLLILALVAAERLRRPYRMTEEEAVWDEEAEHEEHMRAEESGSWLRRYF